MSFGTVRPGASVERPGLSYVALLSGFAFIAKLVANYITCGYRFAAAILSTLLFAAVFVFATYYPHGIPLPTLK